jgi:nucleoside-diphosphate-sugar epimerase
MTAERRKIVVTGASGNVGTGVLRALAAALPLDEVVGICRRPPVHGPGNESVTWHRLDLSETDAVNPPLFRFIVTALHAAYVLPVTPGWYDVAMNSPLMDTSRARDMLDWSPTRSSADSARELLDGLALPPTGSPAHQQR